MPLPDSASARLLSRWVDLCARRWPWVLLLTLALTAGSVLLVVRRLGIETNLDRMLDPDLPFQRERARYLEQFPHASSQLVLVVDAMTPEDAHTAARAFAGGLEARRDLFAYVAVPRANPFLEAHGLYFLDEEKLYDLSDRLAAVQPFLGRLTRDPSLRGLFDMLDRALEKSDEGDGEYDVSPLVTRLDRAVEATLSHRPYRVSWQGLMADEEPAPADLRQFVIAQVREEAARLFPAGDAIRAARQIFSRTTADLAGRPRLRITGSLAMEHEELKTVSRGAEVIGLLTMVLVGIALAVGLRSMRLVVAALVALVVGLALTAGFATLAVGHLNLISVAFGVLYIGLGVDYAIHLCLRHREALENGRDVRAALGEAARDVGGSLLLCTLTTAIGFYAFVPTAYRGVSELGLISGTGMFVSLAVSLTVLPAFLRGWGPKAGTLRRRAHPSRLFASLVDLPVRRRRATLAAALLLALLSAALLPHVRFDLNPLNLRDPDSESVKTFRELVATSRTPPWSIQILAPDRAKAAKEAAALERLDVVDRVVDIDRFVPENQDAKQVVLDDMLLTLGPTLLEIQPVAPPTKAEVLEAARKLQQRLEAHEARVGRDPGATSLAARLGALREAVGAASGDALLADLTHRLLDTLPLTLGRLDRALRTRPFSEGDLPPSLRREWVGADGAVRLEVFPTEDLGAIPALRRFVRAVRGVVPRATGAPVTILASGEAIVAAFRQALVGSVAACTLILIVLLRRPSRVLLVLVPLVFAGFATGAATVLFSMPFNYANVIALPLLFGIGVDSGIHVVHRSEGVLPASAGGNPMRTSTGRAVVFSAITTICSFGSLAFSPHPGTASMGRLLAIGVLTTLFATLWLLPALVLGARRPGEGDSPRGEAARVS